MAASAPPAGEAAAAEPETPTPSLAGTDTDPDLDQYAAQLLATAHAASVAAATERRTSAPSPPQHGNETDAEVICVIRPRNGTGTHRVIVLSQATPEFLQYLDDESRDQQARLATTLQRRAHPGKEPSETRRTPPGAVPFPASAGLARAAVFAGRREALPALGAAPTLPVDRTAAVAPQPYRREKPILP